MVMSEASERILSAVVERLRNVIDPETGVNIIRMRLIEDLRVDERGLIEYTFRPSSPVCPLAVPLAVEIHQAVSEVAGIKDQVITVKGYLHSQSLSDRLNRLQDHSE